MSPPYKAVQGLGTLWGSLLGGIGVVWVLYVGGAFIMITIKYRSRPKKPTPRPTLQVGYDSQMKVPCTIVPCTVSEAWILEMEEQGTAVAFGPCLCLRSLANIEWLVMGSMLLAR